MCVCVMVGSKGVPNPHKVGSKVWASRGWGPKTSRFFSLSRPIFALFVSLWCLLVEFWCCLKRRDPRMCTFGMCRGSEGGGAAPGWEEPWLANSTFANSTVARSHNHNCHFYIIHIGFRVHVVTDHLMRCGCLPVATVTVEQIQQ